MVGSVCILQLEQTGFLRWKQHELKEKSGVHPRFGVEQKAGLPLLRLQSGFGEEI